MSEKKYPESVEEERTLMCGEPSASYAATGSGYVNTIVDDNCMLPDDYDPGIGPYTMEELYARIDEAELALERAEQGDESDWVTAEEMDAEMYKMFPWLK